MTGQTPIQTHLSSNATPTVSHKEILQFISLEGKLRKTKFFKVPSKIFSVLLFVIMQGSILPVTIPPRTHPRGFAIFILLGGLFPTPGHA